MGESGAPARGDIKEQSVTWDDYYRSEMDKLAWFHGEVPRYASEFMEEFKLSKAKTEWFLCKWLSRGWLQEVKVGLYIMEVKPSFDEFTVARPSDPSILVFWLDGDLLSFFATPTTTAEYQAACLRSRPTVLEAVRQHLYAGWLWRAGMVQGAAGRPSQLYCSDRLLARRSMWRWLLAEHEATATESRLVELRTAMRQLQSKSFDGTHANGGSFE